ncbi:MAG: AMP-binding protein, partial [Thermocrispum sp.]
MPSDYVTVESFVDHPRAAMWELLSQPELYPRFFRALGTVTKLPGAAKSAPRYSFLATTAGHTVDYLARMVTNRPEEKLVLASVGESGSWLSVTLSDARPARTKITVVVAKPEGVEFGGQHGRAAIQGWIREGLGRVDDYLSGVSDVPLTTGGSKSDLQLKVAKALIGAGVLAASHPLRGLRQLNRLRRWGFTVAGGYASAAARNPNEIAIADDRVTLTFAELYDRFSRLAVALSEHGVDSRSTVGLLARNHSGFVISAVASAMLGADAVLLNTGLASRQIEDIVRRQDIKVLFTDDEFEPLVQYLPPEVTRISTSPPTSLPGRDTIDDLIDDAPRTQIRTPDREGLLIVLTSGTSGTPKGARRPTPAGWSSIAAMLSVLPLKAEDTMLIAAPVFHTWGLGSLQISTPLRATVVLQDRFDPEDCLRAIEQHRVSALMAVPIMLQRILNLPQETRAKYDTTSLRMVASSGSAMAGPLVTEFMNTFGDILYNFYGSTEVSQAATAGPVDLRAAPTTAGHPPLGSTVAIIDQDGLMVPRGAVGRIFVGNEQPFHGYTADDEPPEIKDTLMDTGDVGFLDADGRLFVSGRDDEMIISGGENVFPRPVEEALAALPQVSEVAVVGVPDAEYGQRLAAFIVPKAGARLDPAMVRSY